MGGQVCKRQMRNHSPTDTFRHRPRRLHIASVLALLLACLLRSSPSAAAGQGVVTVYLDPSSSAAADCGQDAATPCGPAYLSAVPQLVSSNDTAPSYDLLLAPGKYPVGPAGINATNLQLSIQPASGGEVILDCSNSSTCIFADCPTSSAVSNSSACGPDAMLSISGVTIAHGGSEGDGGCIRVLGQSLSLSNSRVINCTAANNGGALFVSGAASVTLNSVNVSGSVALNGDGGAMAFINSRSVVLDGLRVEGCSAPVGGGGGVIANGSAISLWNSTLERSTSGGGGGCLATSASEVDIQGSHLGWCTTLMYGGCYRDSGSNVSVWETSFTGCSSGTVAPGGGLQGYGGCASLEGTRRLSLDRSKMYRCSSLAEGGCLFIMGAGTSCNHTITRSRFRWCNVTATSGMGGAVRALNATLQVENSGFRDNFAVGPNGAVLNGGAVAITDSWASIIKSKFTSNYVEDDLSGYAWGGAVYTGTFATDPGIPPLPVTIDGCIFRGNWADNGGAVYLTSTGPTTITRSTLVDNFVKGDRGGAILVGAGADVSDSLFVTNSALVTAGAIWVSSYPGGNVTITGCNFTENSASNGPGGALGVDSACSFPVAVTNCSFLRNSAPRDAGGAAATQAPSVSFTNCSFLHNSARLKGGALYAGGLEEIDPNDPSSSLRNATGFTFLTACNFSGNSAGLGGGAVFVQGQGQADLVGCFLEGNSAVLGGALLVEAFGVLNVNGGSCTQNSASAAGGCFTVADVSKSAFTGVNLTGNTAGSEGGAGRCTGQAQLTLRQVHLIGNSAVQGGALWVEMGSFTNVTGSSFQGNSASLQGGAVFVLHNANVTVSKTDFGQNTALRGGAVAASGSVAVNVSGGTFEGNALHAMEYDGAVVSFIEGALFTLNNGSSSDGGALLIGGTSKVSVASSAFTANSGDRGGAVFAYGNSTLSLSNCNFTANLASEGAGLYASGFANISATGCEFTRNHASLAGAGLALTESTTGSIQEIRFTSNVASQGGAGVYIQRGHSVSGASTAGAALLPLLMLPSSFPSPYGGAGGDSSLSSESLRSEEVSGERSSSSSSSTSGHAALASLRSAALSSLSLGAPAAPPTAPVAPVEPLEVLNLKFLGNEGGSSQGSAYMDASYDNRTRSSCHGCTRGQQGDSIGSLPSSFRIMWPGSNDSSPSSPFEVFGDKQSPISNLQIVVLDGSGALAAEDFSAVAAINPAPEVSGLLHGTAVNGTVGMPPVYVFSPPEDGSSTLNHTIRVSSSAGLFPPITRQLQIRFCPPGQYYYPRNESCLSCPVGHWCGTGLGAQDCPDATFSFFPGSTSNASCLCCPDDTFANGTAAVTCQDGVFQLSSAWWLDPQSIYAGAPAVYSCDVLDGCAGLTYSYPEQAQCSQGYSQVRLCSTCQPGYYSVLKECYTCNPNFTKLFPLFAVLMVVAWVAMGLLSNALHTIAIFLIEVQLLTFIGTYNLLLPGWVTAVIQYFQISLFIPDIIGPACSISIYGFPAQWALAMLMPLGGFLLFAILYLFLNLYVLINDWLTPPPMPAAIGESQKTVENMEEEQATRSRLNGPSLSWSRGRSSGDLGLAASRTESASLAESASLRQGGAIDIAAKQEWYEKRQNSLLHGLTNWLDLCYACVTFRCLQVFYEQNDGAAVMGAAPTIAWWSTTHSILFGLSVIVAVVYVAGAPAFYAYVLIKGKLSQQLGDPMFKARWGWMVSRYEYKFFWWHLTTFARRIIFACIAVFGVHNPEVQLSATISLQAVRIGLQYGASPFAAFSHDILNSLFALAEFLFTIALASFHYLFLQDAALVVFGLSLALFLTPTMVILSYESLNKYIVLCNSRSMVSLWQQEKLAKSTKSLRRINRLTFEELVHPKDIAAWFRPHVLYAFLQHASRKEARLLLRVRDRYQHCKLAGLGHTDWIKHLTKSQLYAVLSQALLGAAVGEVTIARMPVKTGADGQGGIEEVHVGLGVGSIGGSELGSSRFDAGSISGERTDADDVDMHEAAMWPPRLDKHVQWLGSRHEQPEDSGCTPGDPTAILDPSSNANPPLRGSLSQGSPLVHQGHASSGAEGAAVPVQGLSPSVAPFLHPSPVPLPRPVADEGDDTQRTEARDSVPELRRSSSVASGRWGSGEGLPLLADNASPKGASPGALASSNTSPGLTQTLTPPLASGMPSLYRSSSARRPHLARGPSPLGITSANSTPPPPCTPESLQYTTGAPDIACSSTPPVPRTPDSIRSASGTPTAVPHGGPGGARTSGGACSLQDLGTAEGEPEPEFLEARMNMADLTLTFQRHLALLVRSELAKTNDSLRLLLRSDSIPQLLAWLTSPASTPEDQLLLREMVNAVREGAWQEAGGLQWYTGLACFLSSIWRKKPREHPTLADISTR